jgi:hypothetical protein
VSGGETEGHASSVFADYVKAQLERQDTLKSSLEQRGLAVITTAGALVTLLFGLAALSTQKAQTFDLPRSAGYVLVVALALFFAAAVTAILTNVPLEYQQASTRGIRDAINRDKEQPTPAVTAEHDAALTTLDILESAIALNEGKARVLFWAMAFEVAAVALVGVAVGLVISGWALLGVGVVAIAIGIALYVKVYGLAKPTPGPIADLIAAGARTLGARG